METKEGTRGVEESSYTVLPLFTGKGGKNDCNNYRSRSMLSVAGKVYIRILTEKVMRDNRRKG